MRVALAGKFHHMKCPDPFMIFLIIIACLLDSPDSCQSSSYGRESCEAVFDSTSCKFRLSFDTALF